MRGFSKVSALALVAALGAAPALADLPVVVTSGADTGEGSLRAALASLGDAGGVIALATDGAITIEASLVYEGTGPLTILGAGQVIETAVNETVLVIANGADVTLSDLTLAGPGGFDIENRGDIEGPAGKGLFVDVREGQEGVVSVALSGVTVRDVAGHGVHVSDCDLADACGGGGGGAGGGSPASISLRLVDVIVDGVGYGRFDADGVRVDERAEGDIHFFASGSIFTGVGADGVELDEGQDGDVRIEAYSSVFNDNGGYCDPEILEAFMPAEPEGEFEEGQVAEDAIPGPVTGSPDNQCIERAVDLYDDGTVEEYEFAIDVDDGFDVDEAGPGSIVAYFSGGVIADNLDEGLDYDEEGPGGIDLTLIGTIARGNTDDGFKNSEEDEGGVTGLMIGAIATNNGGVGAVFEEEGEGDVTVEMRGGMTAGNDDGDTSLEVVQEDEGAGSLTIVSADLAEEIEADGVSVSR